MKRRRQRRRSGATPAWFLGVMFAAMAVLSGARASAETAKAAARPFQAVTEQQRKAIDKALAFLARTQNKDGSWFARPGGYGSYPVAMTSLAGLALLSGGHTPGRGKYGSNVRKAVKYLMSRQDRSGLIAHSVGAQGRPMYGHGFATLFLSQVYGMTTREVERAKLAAILKRAVDLTSRSQSRRGGWYYEPTSGSDEGSVTITQIQGLRACRNVGIKVNAKTIKRATEYVLNSQNEDGSINYSVGRSARGGRPALTAAGLEVLHAAGKYGSKAAQKALGNLQRLLDGNANLGFGHGVYFRFYAAQGIFISGEDVFRKYWPKLRPRILAGQNPDGSWAGDHIGEIYGTAMSAIALQLPYQYLPIYQR